MQFSFRVRKERGFAGKWLRKAREESAVLDVTKIWKKLQNPFVLVGQGFLVGGLLIWTTRADASALLAALHLSF